MPISLLSLDISSLFLSPRTSQSISNDRNRPRRLTTRQWTSWKRNEDIVVLPMSVVFEDTRILVRIRMTMIRGDIIGELAKGGYRVRVEDSRNDGGICGAGRLDLPKGHATNVWLICKVTM